MVLTRKDVTSVLGPVDEMTMAEIASTGASLDELREALMWLNNDEVLMGESRPLPGSRVAALIDLLEAEEISDDLLRLSHRFNERRWPLAAAIWKAE